MDHIPAREWVDQGDGSKLQIAETFPLDEGVQISSHGKDNQTTVELTTDQFAEWVTDNIYRLIRMGGRQAAVEAVAAAVPETRLRGRTEWELTEKAHDALRPAEGADTSPAGGTTPGTGDEPRSGPAGRPEPVDRP